MTDGGSDVGTKATLRFWIETGRLTARSIENEVRKAAHGEGLTLAVERHPTLLEVLMLFTVEGDSEVVGRFSKDLTKWGKWMEANG